MAEFLAWEARQPLKFEYRDGALFAMAGATDDHGQIVANLVAIIRPKLRGTKCRVYPQDMKVVTNFPASRYPDLVITCDARDIQDKLIKRHPKLIVEVVSRSTAAIDADDKLAEYETIAELEEYVLIDSRKYSVRVYRRNGHKLETERAAVAGSVELRSIGLDISFHDMYEDVELEAIELRDGIVTE